MLSFWVEKEEESQFKFWEGITNSSKLPKEKIMQLKDKIKGFFVVVLFGGVACAGIWLMPDSRVICYRFCIGVLLVSCIVRVLCGVWPHEPKSKT